MALVTVHLSDWAGGGCPVQVVEFSRRVVPMIDGEHTATVVLDQLRFVGGAECLATTFEKAAAQLREKLARAGPG